MQNDPERRFKSCVGTPTAFTEKNTYGSYAPVRPSAPARPPPARCAASLGRGPSRGTITRHRPGRGQSRGTAPRGTVTRHRHAAPPRGGPSPRRAQAVAGAVSARLPFCSKRPVKFHAPSCSPTHFPPPRFPGTWHSLGPGAAPQSGSRKGVGAPRTSLTGSPPPAARAWRSRGVSEPSQRLGVRRSRPSSFPG